jgi:hypothetical protein
VVIILMDVELNYWLVPVNNVTPVFQLMETTCTVMDALEYHVEHVNSVKHVVRITEELGALEHLLGLAPPAALAQLASTGPDASMVWVVFALAVHLKPIQLVLLLILDHAPLALMEQNSEH